MFYCTIVVINIYGTQNRNFFANPFLAVLREKVTLHLMFSLLEVFQLFVFFTVSKN